MTKEASSWFIAIVANNTEVATHAWLADRVGQWPAEAPYELYLPMVNVDYLNKSGHAREKKKPAIPRFLFIRCTPGVRFRLSQTPNIKRWFMDSTNEELGQKRVCTVPDDTMKTFKRFIDKTNGDCQIEGRKLQAGTKMHFVGGPLKGFCGVVEEVSGNQIIFRTNLGLLGTGTTTIAKESAERWMEIDT